MRNALKAVVACVALAAVGFGSAARAVEPKPTYGMRPALAGQTTLSGGHFSYAVAAGTQLTDAAEVINFSGGPLTIDVYAANLTTASGGTARSPGQRGEAPTGATAWITVSRNTLSLNPNSHDDDQFSISVPTGTAPGDYFAAIVGELGGGPVQPGGLVTSSRVALILQVSVPGAVHTALRLGAFTATRHGGSESIAVEVVNRGNALAQVSGSVDVKTLSGRERIPLGPTGAYVIPAGRATLTGTWRGVPIAGRATLRATVNAVTHDASPIQLHSRALTRWFVPWWGVAALAALVALWLGSRRRRRDRRARRAEEHRVLAEYRAAR